MNQEKFDKNLEDLKQCSAADLTFMISWYEETINQLSSLSQQRSKIGHPRYRGDSREDDFLGLLKKILPSSVGISNGFATNEYATKSYEQDCLLLNKAITATFVRTGKAIYYPVESVLGSIEIKSKIDLSELRKIVLNCVSLKKLAYKLGLSNNKYEDSPTSKLGYFVFAYDSTWSLQNTCEKLNKLLEGVPASLRPNMVYVLKQGLLLPSNDGEFRLDPQQMFSGDSFTPQGKMGTKNIPESDAPPFLWFLSNIIDHCIGRISQAEVTWYGKYVFSPLIMQSHMEQQIEKRDKKN